tara:strand:- start:1001 stop:1174 length:174 start_codon:yes stop_codon:yes gene_type:complete
MNDLIVPGSYVMHPKKKSWGIGQVQSKIKDIITINFENCGKKTINGEKIDLIIVKNE